MNEDQRLERAYRKEWRTFYKYKAPLPLYLGLLAIAAFVGAYFVFLWWTRPEPATIRLPDGFVVTAKVADTPAEQRQGLSDAPVLASDRGMLFVFDAPAPRSFWMKDMRFPIDIIWLDGEMVLGVEHNVPVPAGSDLPSYLSNAPADRVLELSAGAAAEHGVVPGSTLTYE